MFDEKDFYKEIIDNLYDGIYFVNRERVITYWNKGAERITGYSASQAVGRACRNNLLNHVTGDGKQLCTNGCPLEAAIQDGLSREAEVYLHHADGHRLPVLVRASALRDSQGDIIGAIETFSNNANLINTRRRLGEMRQMALTDSLTQIGNRKHLEGRLNALIADFERTGQTGGLLFMDIDYFKKVNDMYGHEVGDKALCMVANTLRHVLRSTDVIGRWGGEEFVAILYDIDNRTILFNIAEKVRKMVEASRLDVSERSLNVTISVGATCLREGDTLESMVRRADEMLYLSKQAGRNCVTSD
jgi:diguanylate cyclase (GGDEF)-like protein/PAS domain S-box-containing protein